MYIQNVGFDEINYLKVALRMDILAWPKCNLTVKESISTPFGMAPPGSLFVSVQSACMRLEEHICHYKLAVRAGVVIIIILFAKAPLSSLLRGVQPSAKFLMSIFSIASDLHQSTAVFPRFCGVQQLANYLKQSFFFVQILWSLSHSQKMTAKASFDSPQRTH